MEDIKISKILVRQQIKNVSVPEAIEGSHITKLSLAFPLVSKTWQRGESKGGRWS